MSFSAAYTMAQKQGLNPATFIPFNPTDEAHAAAVITNNIFGLLSTGTALLQRLAPVVLESGKAWDVCLDCTAAGIDELAALARITNPRLKGSHGTSYSRAEQTLALKQIARLGMFDIPRQLTGEKLGLWVYHLFNNVFILSPHKQVDINHALQRHAVRLRWKGTTKIEPAILPVDKSAALIKADLQTAHKAGWDYLLNWHAAHPGSGHVMDTDDTQHLAGQLHNIIGSLTGREILARHTGRHDWHYYNCHSPATGGTKPSFVLQLQNQHPALEDC